MSKPIRILLVEDSDDDAKLVLRALRGGGFDPSHRRVQTAVDLTAALTQERWDAVISDFRMPGFTGMDALKIVRLAGFDIPFILVSGQIGEEAAVAAMKAGANDYVMKRDLARLASALDRELADAQARSAHTQGQRDQIESEARFAGAFGFAPIGMALLSPDGRFLKVNRALCSLIGHSEAELLARRLRDITYPEDLEASLRNVQQLIAGEVDSFEMEKRYVHARTYIVHASLSVSLVRDRDGQPQYLVAQIQDITARKESEQHLLRMEARYRGLLEAAPDAMVVVNESGNIVLLNVQAEKQLGYRRDELLGQKVTSIIPDGFAQRLLADGLRSVADALAQQIGTGIELTGRRKDGTEFPIEIMLSPLESAEGILVTTAIRDITERKKTQARIVYLNRVYAVLSGINTLIVRVRDRDELFREACRIAVEKGGFRMSWIAIVDRGAMPIELVASSGMNEGLQSAVKDNLSPGEGATLGLSVAAQAIREKRAFVANDLQNSPGFGFLEQRAEAGVLSVAILPLIVADEAVGVLTLCAAEMEFFHAEELNLLTELAGDIAFAIEHISKQERLDRLAYFDALTGLANRHLFLDRVTQYMRSATVGHHRLALFLIDLERFKNINDSLGRAAGDALLREVAAWLTRATGDANLLARVGADEFAVVLPEVRKDGDLNRLVERLMDASVNHPFRLNDAVFRITAKVGATLFPDDGASADALFKNAETALKKAQARGDRFLLYRREMSDGVGRMLTLENQLRQALENEEFVLHYQPKVNLVSGRCTSAEALIRWNDPRIGLVAPGQFIPVLEETGLIHEVGRWALRQALTDYLRWRAAGLNAVRIAVNVSPLQLRHRGFVAEIGQVIGIERHAAAGLELEITESLIMEDVKHSIASLQAIRALGVTVAIDDFGTGFSSLAYLARLPVDTLKIDRSFIIDMTAGPQGLALVSTIIGLAHSLKLKVVAEGVETEEQSRMLRLLNCDEMQGYLYSKPVPAETFEARFLAPQASITS
jgi:diguanylate cyclase (GGDEF)-like protein/PAS domain S-box-containing protein